MAVQSVFDAGDPITSRLKLGVVPDGTTITTVVVKRPDGTVITGLTPSVFGGTGGDEKTVQWYATDDGTAAGTVTPGIVAGDWLAVWTTQGTGASVVPKVYSVEPLPGTGTRASFAPFLSQVGDFVPWLTLDTTVPGADTFLGTFTGATHPTDEIVERHITRVAGPIEDRWPALPTMLYRAARSYIAIRVAANLARTFPRYSGDLSDADALSAQADAEWLALVAAADDATSGGGEDPTRTAQYPIWAFPEPAKHGDLYL
jgi:hypothetical protein